MSKTETAPTSSDVTVSPVTDPDWKDEIEEDIQVTDYSSLVIYSRDWTIETINNQIVQGNIDLNPKFQRRNAWTDESAK